VYVFSAVIALSVITAFRDTTSELLKAEWQEILCVIMEREKRPRGPTFSGWIFDILAVKLETIFYKGL
jgi:hypothetical protein